jgi:hypothetical protein
VIVGVDEKQVVGLQFAGQLAKNGLEGGASTFARDPDRVGSIVTRPISERNVPDLQGSIIVQHINIIRAEAVDVDQGSVGKLHIVQVASLSQTRIENRISIAFWNQARAPINGWDVPVGVWFIEGQRLKKRGEPAGGFE